MRERASYFIVDAYISRSLYQVEEIVKSFVKKARPMPRIEPGASVMQLNMHATDSTTMAFTITTPSSQFQIFKEVQEPLYLIL